MNQRIGCTLFALFGTGEPVGQDQLTASCSQANDKDSNQIYTYIALCEWNAYSYSALGSNF